jgi:hypothetical protein
MHLLNLPLGSPALRLSTPHAKKGASAYLLENQQVLEITDELVPYSHVCGDSFAR